MQLDDKLVNKIVDAVVQRLSADEARRDPKVCQSNPQDAETRGVFQKMEDCISATVEAQKKLLNLTLETRGQIIQAIRETGNVSSA